MPKNLKKTRGGISTRATMNQIFDTKERLISQFRALDLQVERLHYETGAGKSADRALISEAPTALNVALVNFDFFRKNTFHILNNLLSDIEEIARSQASNYPAGFQLSKVMASSPAIIALETISDLRSNLAIFLRYTQNTVEGQTKRPHVPPQQPAPIRVGLENDGKLHLKISQTHKGSLPTASLERLRAATQELLSRTIDQINFSTNIDPRLAPNLRGMLTYLSIPLNDIPIEALGLNFQFAKRSFLSTKDTIPEPLIEQLDQLLTTVSVILNQYDEWRLYLAAQAVTEIDGEDLAKVVEQSEHLADVLDRNEQFVDPKISLRFREIIDAYTSGLINIEAIAVPLVESVGNIFSALSQILIGHIPDTAISVVAHPGSFILILGFVIGPHEVVQK